jgi:CBS domain-containing protein
MYPPFDVVAPEALARVVSRTQIQFFPVGEVILQQGGEPNRHAYVVRTGEVELVDEDRVLDLLGPGEIFGHPSLTAGSGPSFTVRSHEDTLCYLIDGAVMEEILATRAGLTFLSSSLRRRMVRALESLDPEQADPWMVQAGKLIRRPLVTCPPETTVRHAAQTMTSHRVSSLLVPTDQGWGIMTDRDLRSRVLAAGVDSDTPVADVMSFPAKTVPAGALAPEVLRRMLELGVHHFPVVDEKGEVLGVISDSDLMGLERRAPFTLKSAIERAPNLEAAIVEGRQLGRAVCDLVDSNTDPIDIGHVVGVTIDTLTQRLIELAIEDMGEPPAPWAWLALGSEARQEQALHTDQDHALAYEAGDRPVSEVDPYFEKLAVSVVEGLEEAGIPRCRAGVSASERAWRRPIQEWIETFDSWMREKGPEGAIFADIAFDYRRVTGPLASPSRGAGDPQPPSDRVLPRPRGGEQRRARGNPRHQARWYHAHHLSGQGPRARGRRDREVNPGAATGFGDGRASVRGRPGGSGGGVPPSVADAP